MVLFQPAHMGLILFAAIGYASATIGMKMGSVTMTGLAIAIMAFGLVGAVVCEIAILRSADLGRIYIAIIGIESLIVMLYAWYIGEALSLRQLGGASLVLGGLMLVGT